MTSETGKAGDGGDEGRGLRPATELERMGDELARAQRRIRELENTLAIGDQVRHLLVDELNHAKMRATPAPAVEELVEALQDACLMVTAGADRSPHVRAGGVERWIRTINRARGSPSARTRCRSCCGRSAAT